MDIRKVIREEIDKVQLNEFRVPFGNNFKPITNKFDHLKWDFNTNQKHYLEDLCSVDPNSLKESDIKNASKFLGIPEKNVKSIINTYSDYKPMSESGYDSEASMNSRLTFGNKAANAFDIGIENNATQQPIRSSKVMLNNPMGNEKGKSKQRQEYEAQRSMLDRKMYGPGEEHPSKSVERIYENLQQSLMLYLFSECNPNDINLRDSKIKIEFDRVFSEGEFNKLNGGPNYETEKYKNIQKLLKEFNDKFGCSFVISDHIYTEDSEALFIENNVTSQIDMSQTSMDMMKKFLLPRIITGHKIQTNDPSVASLMGLDAGDTTWLYGKIGEPMQSGVLSKIHRGIA